MPVGRYLNPEFRTDTPVLDATIVEEWDVWDGPLYGICEVNGAHFFFTETLESIWRYYSAEDYERRWRIYAVYDLDLAKTKKLVTETPVKVEWKEAIDDMAAPIGIFWT